MPLTVLKNILAFQLNAGATSAATPHGLQIGGTGVVPDFVDFYVTTTIGDPVPASALEVVSVDETNIVVKNNGTSEIALKALVEHWISQERAFPQGTGAPADRLSPQPFLSGLGLGGGSGSGTFTGRVQEKQGANIISANDVTLGADGNTFLLTGNVDLQRIASAGWQLGSVVRLIFNGTPNVVSNTASGAGFLKIRLAGGVNLAAGGDYTVLTLVLANQGTEDSWLEVSRATALKT